MSLDVRIGLGTDLHRLVEGRSLWLGGIEVPSSKGADAHSDGDVVLHSLIDAVLGAAGLGDIGEMFPDDDPSLAGVASATLLTEALARVEQAGWTVGNVDIVIDLQVPKVSPFRAAIRARIAELLAVEVERVFVKAKTGERVGPVGRGEAVGATAVALLRSKK